MLGYIPYLVILTLICLLGNILCWRSKGVMREQLLSIQNTRTERSFGIDDGHFSFGRMLLLCQWFVFFGLQLFLYIDNQSPVYLAHLQFDKLLPLLWCSLLSVAWYFMQWFFFHWWGYIFNQGGRIQILGRIYKSVYMLLGTLSMFSFLLQMAGWIDARTGMILLLLFFICAQIIFIFSGIKIFYNGLYSLLLIILYLCALKIAPILVLWQKLID